VHIQRGGRSVASAKSYLPKFALDEDDYVYHDDEYTEAEKENVDSNLDFLSSHASSASASSASSSLMPRHRYPPELSPIHSP
jgi:hypothetical protein